MFLFLRMVLAHFIADYPLQSDKVYCFKIRSFKGQVCHAFIHAATFALFLIPFWQEPLVWIYLGWITLSHLAFDVAKVKLIDKTNLNPLFTYTVDQVLHILAASAVFLFPFSKSIPEPSGSPLFSWYWNNTVVVFLIGLLFATYFTTYFLACWSSCYKKLEHDDGYFITPLQKYYGILERGAVLTLVAFGQILGLVLFPFVIALRIPVHAWLKGKNKEAPWMVNIPEILVGTLFAVLAGRVIQIYILSQS